MTVVGLLSRHGDNQHDLCGTRSHTSPLSCMEVQCPALPSTALLSLVCRIWGANTLTPLLAAQRCQLGLAGAIPGLKEVLPGQAFLPS